MRVISPSTIWIFEFKMKGDAPSKSPLKQIRDRGYSDKYKSKQQGVREIGVVFDPDERNIIRWEEKGRYRPNKQLLRRYSPKYLTRSR